MPDAIESAYDLLTISFALDGAVVIVPVVNATLVNAVNEGNTPVPLEVKSVPVAPGETFDSDDVVLAERISPTVYDEKPVPPDEATNVVVKPAALPVMFVDQVGTPVPPDTNTCPLVPAAVYPCADADAPHTTDPGVGVVPVPVPPLPIAIGVLNVLTPVIVCAPASETNEPVPPIATTDAEADELPPDPTYRI